MDFIFENLDYIIPILAVGVGWLLGKFGINIKKTTIAIVLKKIFDIVKNLTDKDEMVQKVEEVLNAKQKQMLLSNFKSVEEAINFIKK